MRWIIKQYNRLWPYHVVDIAIRPKDDVILSKHWSKDAAVAERNRRKRLAVPYQQIGVKDSALDRFVP